MGRHNSRESRYFIWQKLTFCLWRIDANKGELCGGWEKKYDSTYFIFTSIECRRMWRREEQLVIHDHIFRLCNLEHFIAISFLYMYFFAEQL